MNRSVKLLILVVLILVSGQAMAMDLGQIQVKSALNQPLVAVIPVTPDHPGEADHIKVELASADAFERAGISRDALQADLKFQVVTQTSQAGQVTRVIRVTSTQPIREPYLDFLVQVSWPKGKMLREYTVLLDPVAYSSAAQAPAATPATVDRQTTAAQPASNKPVTKKPAATAASAGGGSYGPVQQGDTLSHIALTHAVDGVSYQQMLVALRAANPDAFFRDNVNALKAGAVLRIPTRSQAMNVSRAAAVAAVKQENRSWRDAQGGSPTMVANAGGSSTPLASEGGDSNDRLSLVPPSESRGAGGDNPDTAKVAQLRQELSRSKETLSSQKQTTSDLQSRVSSLEQLADKNKKLLSLKNDQIAQLQEKLAAARKQAGMPALPASSAGSAAGAIASASSSADDAALTSAGNASTNKTMADTAHATTAAVATNAPLAATPTQGQKTTSPAPDQQAKPSTVKPLAGSAPESHTQSSEVVPWYEQLWLRIALAVVIVLLIVWAILRRRKSPGKTRRTSVAHHFNDSPLGAADEADAGDTAEAMAAPESGAVIVDDGEQELLAQLAEHPDDVGLHLELVSLYYARQDIERFEGSAEAMHILVDDEASPEWQEVLAMGRELDSDHPFFATDAEDLDPLPADESDDLTGSGVALDAGIAAEGDVTSADMDGDALEGSYASDAYESEVSVDVPPAGVPAADAPPIVDTLDWDPEPDEPAQHHLIDDPQSPPAEDHESIADTDTDAGPAGTESADNFDAPLEWDESSHTGAAESLPEFSGDVDTSEIPGDDTRPEALSGDPVDTSIEDTEPEVFSEDPVDTKLDLARAYIDMGDKEGAQAMLNEVLADGSQMQQDVARRLLDELS